LKTETEVHDYTRDITIIYRLKIPRIIDFWIKNDDDADLLRIFVKLGGGDVKEYDIKRP
jgi:hypothetical protein